LRIATVSKAFLKPSLELSVSLKQQPQAFADDIRFGGIYKLSVLVELRFDLHLDPNLQRFILRWYWR